MHPIFLLLISSALFACAGSSEKPDAADQPGSASSGVHGSAPQTTGVLAGPAFVLDGCYEMTLDRDTARLTLQVKDTTVSGKLQYQLHEKDSSNGTISGVLRDSLIVANYMFSVNGAASVREVIFRIKDTTLVQGFGELHQQNGKVSFRNPSQLQYMEHNPFVKVPCSE